MRRLCALAPLAPLVFLAACGARGAVTFTIHAPSAAPLDPFADSQVSEYLVKSFDGTLIGAVSQSASDAPLPLGPLHATLAPEDLVLSVMAGTDLLGMARIRDVEIHPGVETAYTAEVRKPFVLVGSALPDENPTMDQPNRTQPGMVLDPTTFKDLAPSLTGAHLPADIAAAAATSDGRFLLAGHATPSAALAVIDTGSGQTVGETSLGFLPWRVVTAPRDTAVAVLDASPGLVDGTVLIFPDVAGLTSSPSAAQPVRIALRGESPRNAAFAPDGHTLYVLTGDARNLDPCGAATPPAANHVHSFALDGTDLGVWSLPAFAADLAVDDHAGTVVLSVPLAGLVATIAAGTPAGPVTPQKLLDGLVCPSSLHVTAGDVFVVTAEEQLVPTPSFRLQRIPLAGGAATSLSFTEPVYEATVNSSDTPDGKVMLNVKLRPRFLYGYEIAVAPDASRVSFATRARYSESNAAFDLIVGLSCRATYEMVEYGHYVMDLRSGSNTYTPHAQLVVSPVPSQNQPCITCENTFFTIPFGCPSIAGDRPAGVAAVFGGP